ncbi:tRNA(adenine(34)) deaminase, chloroplastic [Euphorbia lathyris]|uniref:tRNA(adenine(34)) deaminase, chloroplastic n=1 Tax=Euphorbia lathyris TaxID=212925 RepID=UPI0033142B07
MYNTYFSSAVLTLRTKGSLSFSFNDYSNLLSERFDKNLSSSQCCSCCNCCSSCSPSFPTQRVPINPNLFYGLRQSTLIQWSPCKRLIFGGRDPYSYRVPNCGPDHGCFDVSCSFEENSSGRERIERRRKGRIGRINLRGRQCLSSADDAEAVISFLSEEVSEEYLGDRDRNGRRFRKRVEMEKRSNYTGEKKNDRLSQFESVKSKYERNRRKEELEEHRRREEGKEFRRKEQWKEYASKEDKDDKEERRTVSRGENHRERKPSSSYSSCYSLSSVGDFGNDKETQDENVGLLEASSSGYNSGYNRDSWSIEDNIEEEVEDFERQGDMEQGKFLEKKTSTRRTSADWELRKRTEKKLTEIEETQSQKESSRLHSRTARTSESDKGKVSGSYEQIGDEHGKLTMTANVEKGRTNKYIRKTDQEVTDINAKRSSLYQGQFIGREGDLKVDADLVEEKRGRYNETVDVISGIGNRRNNLQQSRLTEIGNVVKKDTKLQSLSESRMKIREEDVALRSGSEASERRQQAFKQITEQIESRSASQRLSETSKINNSSSRKTSILQSETGIKNREGSAPFVSHSVKERKEQRSQADQKDSQRIQSGKGSLDVTSIAVNVTNVSVMHATDIERVNYTQVTSDRMTDQGSECVPAANPIQEARERETQNNESTTGVKLRDEALKATEVSYFQEQNSQLASSSHAYLDMVSQAQSQQINVEGGYRSSQPTMMPPSPQMVDRGPFHVDPVSGIATQEVLGQASESSYSAIPTYSERTTLTSRQEPYGRGSREEIQGEALNFASQDDAIVSAQRLEESSKKFVGEFIDMARNEALTSELPEGENDKRTKASHSGSEVSQLKELDSRRSSGVSGAKGPSDEMWDVTDPSAQEPPKTEAPEDSATTKNTVIRRSGKSLWGFISDVVRLRWGSHVETPKSAKRSGGKSSSNDSVSSETWFSGRDAEETSDKNVEKEKSMSKEATSSHHQQPMQASIQGQEEAADTLCSKSIIRQLEPNASSPSTTYISGSTSKGISSPAEEENLVWGQDRKSFEGTQSLDGKSSYVSTPSSDAGKSSVLPLPSSGMSTLVVEEFYGRDRTDVSVGGAMEMREQPLIAKSTEASGSEGKDGELKQRRLQRNKQVVKDKFDEWEEAYVRESEQRKIDEMFMREALVEAKKAADTWEVPVGAVLVQHGKVIARGYNLVEALRDSTAHAEMICIREASNQLRSWRLAESTLYVTLEPCAMCAGAILQSRIDTLVWGAPNKLLGADGSWIRLFPNSEGGNESEVRDKPAAPLHPFHPKMTIRRGIMESECADVMQQFFQLRRRKKVKNEDTPPQPSLPIATHQSKFLRKMHDIFHAFLCM